MAVEESCMYTMTPDENPVIDTVPGTNIVIGVGFSGKGLSIYYVSSYNKAGSFRMLTNAYLREQGFIQKLMSYKNPH